MFMKQQQKKAHSTINNFCFCIRGKNTRSHFAEIDVTRFRGAKKAARAQMRAQAARQQQQSASLDQNLKTAELIVFPLFAVCLFTVAIVVAIRAARFAKSFETQKCQMRARASKKLASASTPRWSTPRWSTPRVSSPPPLSAASSSSASSSSSLRAAAA